MINQGIELVIVLASLVIAAECYHIIDDHMYKSIYGAIGELNPASNLQI